MPTQSAHDTTATVSQAPATSQTMDADAPAATCMTPASDSIPPPTPAMFTVRARSCRMADLGSGAGAAFSGPPDTPPTPAMFAVRTRSCRMANLGSGAGAAFSGPPDTPPTPAMFAVRTRSCRMADLGSGADAAFSGPPDTPPRPSLVTVPFQWEEAPGKAKASPTACAAATAPAVANTGPIPKGETGSDCEDSSGHADETARPLPVLKLPPRLQQVPPSFAGEEWVSYLGLCCWRQSNPK